MKRFPDGCGAAQKKQCYWIVCIGQCVILPTNCDARHPSPSLLPIMAFGCFYFVTANICQAIKKSSSCAATNEFHEDDADDDVERKRFHLDLTFAGLPEVKETVIDAADHSDNSDVDNSGVRARLKNRKCQPIRRRKQVFFVLD